MENRSMETEWKEKFGFLGSWKLAGTYRTLLGIAASASDIKRLHGLLPEYCRLNHEKLIELTDFWTDWFKSARVEGGRLGDDVARFVLLAGLDRWKGLGGWYWELLKEQFPSASWPCEFPGHMVIGDNSRVTYRTELLGHEATAIFAFLADTRVAVMISISTDRLTEPFVHQMKTISGLSFVSDYLYERSACFYFTFEDERLRTLPSSEAEMTVSRKKMGLEPGGRFVKHDDELLAIATEHLVTAAIPVAPLVFWPKD